MRHFFLAAGVLFFMALLGVVIFLWIKYPEDNLIEAGNKFSQEVKNKRIMRKFNYHVMPLERLHEIGEGRRLAREGEVEAAIRKLFEMGKENNETYTLYFDKYLGELFSEWLMESPGEAIDFIMKEREKYEGHILLTINYAIYGAIMNAGGLRLNKTFLDYYRDNNEQINELCIGSSEGLIFAYLIGSMTAEKGRYKDVWDNMDIFSGIRPKGMFIYGYLYYLLRESDKGGANEQHGKDGMVKLVSEDNHELFLYLKNELLDEVWQQDKELTKMKIPFYYQLLKRWHLSNSQAAEAWMMSRPVEEREALKTYGIEKKSSVTADENRPQPRSKRSVKRQAG